MSSPPYLSEKGARHCVAYCFCSNETKAKEKETHCQYAP